MAKAKTKEKKLGIYSDLRERGFLKQETAPSGGLSVEDSLNNRRVTFYVGFDPTADSMHVGHLLPIMAMAHLQKAGHLPIAIIGGGTTMIGDPSGKTEMRKMLSKEDIDSNGRKLLAQLKRYLEFGEGRGLFLNNAEWLLPLNYIEFLRDYGKYFKVNEMIRVEAYRMRLEQEQGLSFIEFNYQLLQAYDFLILYEQYGCTVQMGGDDQWSNILAGVDLIRKVTQGNAQALTFPLLTTAGGKKMGKTESGAVWLDPEKTSPYDFYQYWINSDDRDVEKFLKLFTFLPLDEISSLCEAGGQQLRAAKQVLAFEATKVTHGEEEAEKAQSASQALFGDQGAGSADAPSITFSRREIESGLKLVEALVTAGLSKSKTEATKLITAGGIYANNQAVENTGATVSELLGNDTTLLLRKGKKTYRRIVIEG